MVRILLVLSVFILFWAVVYPTVKDGKIYYGSGDHTKEGRKSFSFGNMWKAIVSKLKRKKGGYKS